MDFVTIIAGSVAFIALAMMLNLFISLRKTDEAFEAAVKEAVIEKPTTKKVEQKSKKAPKKVQKTEFKHSSLIVNLKGHTNNALSGSFSSNGKFVTSCDSEKSVFLWITKDFNKGNTHVRVNTEYDPVCSVHFSPDSKALVAGLQKTNSTRVYRIGKKDSSYELVQAVEVADLHPEAGLVRAKIGVQLSSGVQTGAFLFHQYHDSTVVLTDLRGCELARMKCGGGNKHQIELSNCGRYIAVCGDSPELRAWAVIFKSGKFVEVKRLPSLIGHKPKIVKFAFSPDSTRLITLDAQENIKVWEMDDWANKQTPRELFSFKNPFGLPGMMTIAPDNLTVAMVQFNKLITFDLSDVKTFNIIENCFTSAISHIDYDPTSNTVAISGDKCVRILHNITGWRARLSDYMKQLELASNETHRNGLAEQISAAKNKLLLFE